MTRITQILIADAFGKFADFPHGQKQNLRNPRHLRLFFQRFPLNDPRFYDRQLVSTGDGSHSIYLPAFDEFYHSSHGALRESLHVFIRHGYELSAEKRTAPLRILEMGFGTGLNAFLTWMRHAGQAFPLEYASLEAYPVSLETVSSLNYLQALQAEQHREIFERMHTCSWGKEEVFPGKFTLLKLQTTLEEFAPAGKYDLVFYDAFAPRVQPELWTREVFDKLFACMENKSLLTTYCAKGEVKRSMKAAGFRVEALPGPPGKREMTLAWKDQGKSFFFPQTV